MRSQQSQHVRRRRSGPRLPAWATYVLLAVFVLGVIGLAFLTFNGVKRLVSRAPLGSGNDGFALGESGIGGGQPGGAAAGPGEELGDEEVWSEGRVTVLLMGIDERESEHGPWRTDTMMILTMDPATRTAGLVSIPRDMWVEIPDYGVYDRINTANFRGDADQYPGGGGPALAMKTVQQNLGVEVNYFATINFNGFLSVVDQLGCVPIEVPETIDDPDYPAMDGPGYDPFYIEAGSHCLDSHTLLKYARTRATFGGDFDRAQRQQDVLHAIREHVLSTNQLPNLIANAPQMYNTLEDSVNTNLTEGQIIQLARLGAQIPRENICSAVIAGDYVEKLETLADGSAVVMPNRAKVRQLILDVYTGTGRCSPEAQDYTEDALAESARISVLNGTMQEGLATETSNRLKAAGLDVVSMGNGDRFDYEQTIIYNYSGKTATAQYIASLLHLPTDAIVEAEDSSGMIDVEVVLGSDITTGSGGEE